VADWAQLAVAPAITLSVQSSAPLLVAGTISPPKRRVTIELHRIGAGRKPVVTKHVAAGGGRFSATISAPGPGDYELIARHVADATNAAGASQPVAVTVA
jgi:hypothetical protein